MSLAAMSWAFARKGLRPIEKVVLLVLADFANDDGECWPGQASIAERADVSDRTVRTVLVALEEQGVLRREERRRPDGYRSSDFYQLQISPEGFSGEVDLTGKDQQSHRKLRAAQEPSVEPSVNTPPTPSAEAAAFAKAWEAWPRKDGKQAAIKAWRRAVREHHQAAARGEVTGAPIDAVGWAAQVLLADTVARFGAAHGRHTPPRFIPHLSTWLNQERWTDPLPVGEDRGARTPEPPRRGGIVIPQGHVPVRDEMGHIIGSEPAS